VSDYRGCRGIGRVKVGRYLIAFVLFMCALITFGDRGVTDNFRMREKLMSLKKTNHETTLENIALQKNISLLRDDLSYIEKIARNELGMVKKGDLVYRTVVQ
jgi:cell division protein FtsB